MTRCDFLDHTRLRHAPALRALAVDLLIEEALGVSTRFRLDFDAPRLLPLLDPVSVASLFSGPPVTAHGGLERQEGPLDYDRARLLREMLSFGPGPWPDPPVNYIEQAVFFDERGDVVLRASDSAEFILFALPQDRRDNLVGRYLSAGIPVDAIEPVDVDINSSIG